MTARGSLEDISEIFTARLQDKFMGRVETTATGYRNIAVFLLENDIMIRSIIIFVDINSQYFFSTYKIFT